MKLTSKHALAAAALAFAFPTIVFAGYAPKPQRTLYCHVEPNRYTIDGVAYGPDGEYCDGLVV